MITASSFGTFDFSVWRLLLVALVIICAGAVGYVAAMDRRRAVSGGAGSESPTKPIRSRPAATPATATPVNTPQSSVPQPPVPPPPPGPGEDAGRLLRALVGAYDTSSEESVRLHITQELHKAGVDVVIVEPGRPFSADHMRCVATEDAPDAQDDGLVVRTERPGWIRADGAVVRVPEVTIWKAPR